MKASKTNPLSSRFTGTTSVKETKRTAKSTIAKNAPLVQGKVVSATDFVMDPLSGDDAVEALKRAGILTPKGRLRRAAS